MSINHIIETDPPSEFELALSQAASASTDASDLRAVRNAFEYAPPLPIPAGEMRDLAAAWLHASFILRANDLPRTMDTMAGLVAAGNGFAAVHARRIIEILTAAGPANDVEFREAACAETLGIPRRVRRSHRGRR